MGANKPGDIQELVEIAAPTHGIITNIGRAHLEGFGSLEGVIQTKTEMYRYIQASNGCLFYNAGDEILKNHLPADIPTASYGINGEVSGELVQLSPFVEMRWMENEFVSPLLKTQLIGEYNFINFLAAIRIGRYFGISRENCSKAIEAYTPTNNRSQVTKTAKNTIIVDCYNANPTSMQSALNSFARIDQHAKIFILGDMREMGADAAMVHEEIVQLTIDLRLSGFFIGEEFLKFKGMHPQAIFLKSTDPLIEHFEQNPPSNLLILLKGSRGIALEKVIPYL
jgi:UDP-N-acetylmuramoyl-tripeptide--D-alanyl-D-alanine ligase